MTYDLLRQYIDAAERGELMYLDVTIKDVWHLLRILTPDSAIQPRITPKPVYRAWETVDEVPVGAWVREKAQPRTLHQISGVVNTIGTGSCVMAGATDVGFHRIPFGQLLENYELTTDLKTFTPCGVEVKEWSYHKTTTSYGKGTNRYAKSAMPYSSNSVKSNAKTQSYTKNVQICGINYNIGRADEKQVHT